MKQSYWQFKSLSEAVLNYFSACELHVNPKALKENAFLSGDFP